MDRAAVRIRDALLGGAIDHVVISGDLTERGRRTELARFEELFGPLQRAGRLSIVPGNHDRLTDDVGARIMRGGRVETHTVPGLHIVRVDSTGPHNKFLLAGHGEICEAVLDGIDAALAAAPPEHLVAVVLHHHPLALPEETFPERLATRLGWPWATELALGLDLLQRIRGRCDLVLHGHRHIPRSTTLWAGDARPLRMYNAGCTTALGRFRLFAHADGKLLSPAGWFDVRRVSPLPRPVERRTGMEMR